MKILYLTQYFPPEVGATQTRAWEMAANLVKQGHQVTVLTEFPNHPRGIIPPEFRGKLWQFQRFDGIDVVRTWVFTRPEKTFLTRMAFYLSFMFMAMIVGAFLRGRFDIVYATSPPFFVGVSGLFLSRLRNARFVFEIRDLWPQSAVELGELQNRHFIRWAEKLERVYYEKAVRLIAVTQGIHRQLVNRGYDAKSRLILNGTNTEMFYFTTMHKKTELGLAGKYVVMYAGILGIAQGMEQLCDLIACFKSIPEVHFVFIGEGPMKSKILEWQRTRNLSNLMLLGEIPREKMAQYLSAADCCLVPLKKSPLFRGALPSKMFDCMACERPIILSVDGEARQLLEQTGAGLYAAPENTEEMFAAILRLKGSPDLAAQMGKNGRALVLQRFSRRQKALELERELLQLEG